MRLSTSIGVVVIESDFAPLLHFMELRGSAIPSPEEREVRVRVEQVPRSEIGEFANDPMDSYPRRLYVEGCEFVISRDRIDGRVPQNSAQVGLILEYIWYALPVFCCPNGWEAVHAAAVESDRGATLIFGASGAGKTRAAIDMMQTGWRYFADDVVLVNAEGTQARGWDNTLHVDPRTAKEAGWNAFHLDWCGKMRMPPPAMARRLQAPIVGTLTVGENPVCTHDLPGGDSEWVPNYGAGARLLAAATAVPTDAPDIRVALVNRNPWKTPTKWWGGDMVNLFGYRDGLRALGVQADFVPFDELDESKYDLLHLFHAQAQYPWTTSVARHTTKPLVVTAITQQAPWSEDTAATIRRAAMVLCYSPLEEDHLASHCPDVPRERFITAPQGVPDAIYQQSEPVSPTFSVFMAGRYCMVKNQLAVLQACKRLDVPVTFAGMMDEGQGGYLVRLREEAGEWTGVRFLGTLKGEALWRRYRAAHVHVQPSVFESFGLSTWEALACGCNCVVTGNGWGGPLFDGKATICDPDAEAVRLAIQYELRLARNHHNFHPPTWGQASRALIPIYRKALA